jgi:hypothetical protein
MFRFPLTHQPQTSREPFSLETLAKASRLLRATMAPWRAHRCRNPDPFGSDAPQRRSSVHIGRRDFSFVGELGHPFCVRQDTSHIAVGSQRWRIV